MDYHSQFNEIKQHKTILSLDDRIAYIKHPRFLTEKVLCEHAMVVDKQYGNSFQYRKDGHFDIIGDQIIPTSGQIMVSGTYRCLIPIHKWILYRRRYRTIDMNPSGIEIFQTFISWERIDDMENYRDLPIFKYIKNDQIIADDDVAIISDDEIECDDFKLERIISDYQPADSFQLNELVEYVRGDLKRQIDHLFHRYQYVHKFSIKCPYTITIDANHCQLRIEPKNGQIDFDFSLLPKSNDNDEFLWGRMFCHEQYGLNARSIYELSICVYHDDHVKERDYEMTITEYYNPHISF